MITALAALSALLIFQNRDARPHPTWTDLSQFLSSRTGGRRDYPLQTEFRYADARRVDALSIVECLSPGETVRLPFEPAQNGTEPTRPNAWVEHVKVVASGDLPAGSAISVVLPTAGPAFTMVPGHRYLLLVGRPHGGKLEIPAAGTYDGALSLAATTGDTVAGLAAMETQASSLDGSTTREDRIANSVVDALAEADDAEFRRAANWLAQVGDPGGGWRTDGRGREPFALSERLTGIAQGLSGYRRMRLFEILCAWHVLGSEQPYVDAMISLAGETNPFDPLAAPVPASLEFGLMHRSVDPTYVPVKLDANRWADVIVGAKNDGVRNFLLMETPRSPDEAHNRHIAEALLDGSHDGTLRAAVRHFSLVLKHPEWTTGLRTEQGRVVWSNKDAVLAAIRTHYGIAAKP